MLGEHGGKGLRYFRQRPRNEKLAFLKQARKFYHILTSLQRITSTLRILRWKRVSVVSLLKHQRSFNKMPVLDKKLLVAILQGRSLYWNVPGLAWRVHKKAKLWRFTPVYPINTILSTIWQPSIMTLAICWEVFHEQYYKNVKKLTNLDYL